MKHQQNDLTSVLHRPVETATHNGRSPIRTHVILLTVND